MLMFNEFHLIWTLIDFFGVFKDEIIYNLNAVPIYILHLINRWWWIRTSSGELLRSSFDDYMCDAIRENAFHLILMNLNYDESRKYHIPYARTINEKPICKHNFNWIIIHYDTHCIIMWLLFSTTQLTIIAYGNYTWIELHIKLQPIVIILFRLTFMSKS